MYRFAVLGAVAVALAGCGIAAKINARNDMERSKTAYTSCLSANSSAPARCEGFRMAYEADLEAYRATSAGISPAQSIYVNTSGR